MDKNAIKKFAIWARRDLIERVTQRAMKYGIVANEPADLNADSANGYLFSPIEKRQRQTLINKIQEKGFEQVIEEVAYTWFNRFAALRFMEVNDYLPTHIRVFTNESGEFKPQILSEAIHLDIQGLDLKKVYELESANKKDELYKYLLIVQCNALSSILPRMFQKIEDYTELLLPDNLLRDGNVLEQMVTSISADDWKDQVQIIGWLYQYYNTEQNELVYDGSWARERINKELLPAATTIYTPDWPVHYMVENSLGRLWLEGHPNDTLKSNWKYYLDEAEQEADVQAQLDIIRNEYAKIKPEEIRVIDPCMGSGHILCVLFDVLVQIYTDYGYSEKEAVASIIEKNLYGLDIDERASQLAYFAVMMKARQYDRRFFSRNLQPHVYQILESNGISQEVIDYFISKYPEGGVALKPLIEEGCQPKADGVVTESVINQTSLEQPYSQANWIATQSTTARNDDDSTGLSNTLSLNKVGSGSVTLQSAKADSSPQEEPLVSSTAVGPLELSLKNLLDQTRDATEYGSLITISDIDFNLLYQRIEEIKNDDSFYRLDIINQLLPLIEVAQVLAQKYHVVVTNPPYLSNSRFSPKLDGFVKSNYSDEKADLSMAMLKRTLSSLSIKNGFISFITTSSWLFLSSFGKIRDYILSNQSMVSIVDFGTELFDGKVGHNPITALVNRNSKLNYTLSAVRLVDFCYSRRDEKEKEFFNKNNLFLINQNNFRMINGFPFTYWLSQQLLKAFNQPKLIEIAKPRQGLATGDNNKFLRLWFECYLKNIKFGTTSIEDSVISKARWFPYNKGGEFRKWYGNNDYVVNWFNDGYEIRHFTDDKGKLRSRPQNTEAYFKESITWSKISSGAIAFRYKPFGHIFDVAGTSIFADRSILLYLGGLCNSKVSMCIFAAISPTLNYEVGHIASLPVIVDKTQKSIIESFVEQNISLSKSDWDSFETSWDFVRHPLVKLRTENGKLKDGVIGIGCDYSVITGEDNPKASPGREVNEFEVTHNFLEQTSSQAKEVDNTLSLNKVGSGSVTLSACKQATSPQGEALENIYQQWSQICTERFNQLKSNEEELNRIFIDIYGLNDELTPEVEDKDVTVRKADLQREIRSFISYAVGCMMGRYSLDCDGLAFAGGEWDKSKYYSFMPDEDGIIPITDDEYFNDDIVGRFIDFVKVVYGEDTLEDNLKFIADAIGGKGSARQVIRNYFISEFFADHVKVYQKRPIYWLFDSGKKNGFKCLIYMHRYQPDTLARIRTDYVHEQQARYRTAIADLEQRINGASTSERVKLNKQLVKIKDQAEEIRLYEEKIHHLADQMIKIDLDDGVKHNYSLFAEVLAKIK